MKTRRIVALEERRDNLMRKLEEMDDLVITRGSEFDENEQATYDQHSAELDQVAGELKTLVERQEMIDNSRKLGASLGDATSGGGITRVNEPELYRADQGPKDSFIYDLYRSQVLHDQSATERLVRHNEIRRATVSTDLPGIVVPQYSTDIVPFAKEGRPFLNSLTSRPVTAIQMRIPTITTDLPAGFQSTQNSAFATSNPASTEVAIDTKTVGGYIDVSVQSLDFGAVDQSWVFEQLLRKLYSTMDYYALQGVGTSGTVEGLFESDGCNDVNGETYSAFAEHYAGTQYAASLIRSNQFVTPTHVIMSATRWYALLSSTDADGRPLAGIFGSNPMNVGQNTQVGGTSGVFAGLPVVVDQNVVRTTEDDTFMAVYYAPLIWFAESTPAQLVVEAVGAHTGTVRFVLRAYMQFSAEVQPKATTIIRDLTPPEFPTLPIS